MLPGHLRAIKERLVAKGYSKRTTGEDELFYELEYLDKTLTQANLTEAQRDFAVKMVGGSPGSCECCGRAF
jgi:hypothetical protein